MASRFVSFPNPRSCEILNTPLEALADEKENKEDINAIDINLKMFFIILPLFNYFLKANILQNLEQ
tara:strand:- start:401 stop:598 length:198 start_codon:yes stop_codon:yes gene_type:complete